MMSLLKGAGESTGTSTAMHLPAVAALTLGFSVFNNDMPLGVHPDEPKKVDFVLRGSQDFKHPVLMLQVNRLCEISPVFRTFAFSNPTVRIIDIREEQDR